MEDFAAGAMIRLVRAGLAAQGLALPTLPDGDSAHVPLQAKRGALRAILQTHGPLVVLRISDVAGSLPPDPVSTALTKAPDVADLMDRWARLERFSHSRHRMRFTFETPGRLRLHHVNAKGGPPPEPGETLVVLGLLTQLIERITPTPIRLVAAETGDVLRQDGDWTGQTVLPDGTVTFQVAFDPSDKQTSPQAAMGEVQGPSLVTRLRGMIRSDPARNWRLGDLAGEAALSQRTLQRRLAAADTHLSRLLSQVRLEAASELLSDAPDHGLAEIGFLCGFSDQAHFSRRFKAAVGTAPGRYRKDFSVKNPG